ncbi:MAG TPA: hypothetical protein VKC61_10145 [Pyrinomonadaceae bacterium]|nr:hypothetical protein [Pyrinomonadaceae bacterium]
MKRLIVSLFIVAVCVGSASAITYQVGPSRTYTKLQDVQALLAPGDLVEVDGNATYPGDIILTRPGTIVNKITIRGLRVNGLRPILSGGTNTIEFRLSDHYIFEGFDVTGGSFRGIYHHADDITIRDTVVHDCPAHGILGADTDSGSLTLEYVEIYHCGNGTGQHPLYMATDEFAHPGSVFRMQYCYLHDQNGGNNIKSRAERNEIYYNWVSGGFYGEIELIGPDPHGNKKVNTDTAREDSDVVGNVFQHIPTQGTRMARVGSDGTGETKGRYRFVNNTFILRQGQVSPAVETFEGIESLEMHNNVFFRVGGAPIDKMVLETRTRWVAGRVSTGSNNWIPTGSALVPTAWIATIIGADPGFTNISTYDVRPISTSPLVNAGDNAPASPAGHPFINPLFPPAFIPPLHTALAVGTASPRPVYGGIDIGAYEWTP